MGEAKRRKEAVLKRPCPCGSTRTGRHCCFDGVAWRKPAAHLGLQELPAGSALDRCYMRELASCAGPISGEHLISLSVIEILQGQGSFSISGVPWLQQGEQKILSPKSLRANCLCTKHNSALSPIDDAARYLFQSLKSFFEEDTGEPRHALVSGHDLERWLLKTAKALAVSGNLAKDNKRLSGAFAQGAALISMLDDVDAWPEGAGLYCTMMSGDVMVNHPRFQLSPWTDESDTIVALQVSILGVVFVLLLEPLDPAKYPILKSAKYRPGRIEIRYPTSHSWLTLSWQDREVHQALQVEFVQKIRNDAALS